MKMKQRILITDNKKKNKKQRIKSEPSKRSHDKNLVG